MHTKEDLLCQFVLVCTRCCLGTWPRKVCRISRMYAGQRWLYCDGFQLAKMDLFKNGTCECSTCLQRCIPAVLPSLLLGCNCCVAAAYQRSPLLWLFGWSSSLSLTTGGCGRCSSQSPVLHTAYSTEVYV